MGFEDEVSGAYSGDNGDPREVLRMPAASIMMRRNAGCWIIGGTLRVFVGKRPRWLTRVLMRWLLEWDWEDSK